MKSKKKTAFSPSDFVSEVAMILRELEKKPSISGHEQGVIIKRLTKKEALLAAITNAYRSEHNLTESKSLVKPVSETINVTSSIEVTI